MQPGKLPGLLRRRHLRDRNAEHGLRALRKGVRELRGAGAAAGVSGRRV
jgi:hypothetical protein